MHEFWEFLLLGFGLSPAFALTSQSLVLVYRGSAVVNFAASGFAALGAYTYLLVREGGAPTVIALAAGIAAGALTGGLTYVLVMQRLARAAAITRLIATLGVSIVIIEGLGLHYGTSEETVVAIFGTGSVSIFGAPIAIYSLSLFGGSIVLTAALWAVYRLTKFGLQTSAVAENARSAGALGIFPERVGLINWMLGGLLSALAGILVAPLIGLTVQSMELLMIPALAAALLGSFTSFWWTLAGAVLVGVGESELTHYNLGTGWSEAFPFVVIIVVLMFRGSALPARSVLQERLPAIGTGKIRLRLVLPAVALATLATGFLHATGAGAVATTAAIGIILLSLVLVAGYAGQVSLAQLGLAGMGAFIAARFAQDLGWSFWPVMAIGILLTMPLGAIVGLPALRARGVNLAIVTLGVGLVIQDVVLTNDTYTGGYAGLTVKSPSIFGFALDATDHPVRYAILSLVFFALAAVLVANLRRGRVGRQLIAVRDNERASATLGINLALVKLYAFVVGAGLAALGGVLLAFSNSVVLLGSLPFDVNSSITILGFLVMGGIGFIGGAVFGSLLVAGGVFAWILGVFFVGGNAANWLAIAAGVGTVFTVIFQPDGAAGKMTAEVTRVLRKRSAGPTRGCSVSSGLGDPADLERRPDSVLQVEALRVRFGAVVALDELSLELRSGEILGVIGPNGAGKTTMIDAITGVNRRYSGRVLLNGRALERMSATKRGRIGISRSFQSLELFDDLSVEDNLRVASDRPTPWNYFTDLLRPGQQPLPPAAAAAVREFELADELGSRPHLLPFGRRRLVGIARSVAATPAVLLLDEPAAGLDDHESEQLATMLRRLARKWNFAILLIEHDMDLVMGVCDRIVAIDFGREIAAGAPDDVRTHPNVLTAYLGEEIPSTAVAATP